MGSSWALMALLLGLLLGYNFCGFELIGQLLGARRTKYIRILLLGLMNSGLVLALSFTESSSTAAAYVGIFLILIAEVWLLYRPGFRKNLFVVVTFMLHIMVFHTVVCVLVAWTNNISMYDVANRANTLYFSFLFSLLGLLAATLMVRFILPLPKVRIVLQNANQRMYQTVWMSICVLYLLYNAKVYQQDMQLGFFYIDQILKCITMLLGGYVMLFYNFRVSELLGYKEKSEDLTNQLSTNVGFLDALTGNAVRRYEINVTRDMFRIGLPDEDLEEEEDWLNFSKGFPEVAQEHLVLEDLPGFLKVMSRKRLLEAFARGSRKFVLDYRVGCTKQETRWHRMHVNLIEEEETGDVLAMAYTVDVHEEYEEKRRLYEQAQLDMMTGVYNRDTFEDLVEQELLRGRGILLMADIDNFKAVNDLLGHARGDEVLKRTAELLKSGFRADDIVGRFGGDEFMVYIKNSAMTDTVLAKVAGIQQRAEMVLEGAGGAQLMSSLSIGLVEIPAPGIPFQVAYKQADTALYRSKKMGKNLYSIYQGEDACALASGPGPRQEGGKEGQTPTV